MAKKILGKVAISPRGEYAESVTYYRLDLVSYNGSSYLSKIDNNTSLPTTAENWMLVVKKGDPFTYADFTPEQLEALKVKGDKGDAFEYSDFTPEQIQELQAPAKTNPGVIDLQPGEYLMDVINAINALPENEKPTESNPLTINMYNHNFTVDYDRITAKVVIPKHVYIHLAGNYSSSNDINEIIPQKAFIGFDFSNASPRSLPMRFLAFAPFAPYVTNEVELEADIPNSTFDEYFGVTLVYAKDTKKYFLVRDTEIIDVTVNLRYYTVDDARLGYFCFVDCQNTNFRNTDCKNASFYSADCKNASFYSADCKNASFDNTDCKNASFDNADCKGSYFGNANCQRANFINADCQGARFSYADCKGTYFDYTDCKGAHFRYTDCQGARFDGIQLNNQCNFQGANLTGVQNMPATLNTKAKFIAVVGAGNVNAQTIWIDGTSILS